MKNLALAINNRDFSSLQRLVNTNVHEAESETARVLFNGLFKKLKVMFPAMVTVIKTKDDLEEIKKQWVLAFVENGIRTEEQISAGLVEARKQSSPFLPSPGQFIEWCQQSSAKVFGLPDVDMVMDEFNNYCANRLDYPNSTQYPWPHPVLYWIVTELRQKMIANNETGSEVKKRAENLLVSWAKKINSGITIPTPVIQIDNNQKPPPIAAQSGNFDRYRMLGEMYRKKRAVINNQT